MLNQYIRECRPLIVVLIIVFCFSAVGMTSAQRNQSYTVTLQIDELRCVDQQEDRVTDAMGQSGDEIALTYSLIEAEDIDDEAIDSVSNSIQTAGVFTGVEDGDHLRGMRFSPIELDIHEGNYMVVSFDIIEVDSDLNAVEDAIENANSALMDSDLANQEIEIPLYCDSGYCQSFTITIGAAVGIMDAFVQFVQADDDFGTQFGYLSWDQLESYSSDEIEEEGWEWDASGFFDSVNYEIDFTLTIED